MGYTKSDLVDKVFKSDDRIRYCAVVDEKGNRLAGGMRPGVDSLEPQRETVKLHVQGAIHKAMDANWDNYLGEVDYVVVHRRKVVLILFPLPNSKHILISAEPEYPTDHATLQRELGRIAVG